MANSNLFQNVYLFKELSPGELQQISDLARTISYNPGDEIFMEGDEARSLYVIKYGSVKIQHTGNDDSVSVATFGSGSHFGEMAFVDGEKRSATVIAIERTDLLTIDFQALQKLLDANPTMAVKVYRSLALFLCGRLRLTTNDLSFAREKNLRHF